MAARPRRPDDTPGLLYRGSDLTRLQTLMDAHFTPHTTDVVGRRPLRARMRMPHGGPVSLYEIGYGTGVVVRSVRPPDYYGVRVAHTGHAQLTSGGRTVPFSPSVVNPGQVLSAHCAGDVSTRILRFSPDLVRTAIGAELGAIPEDLPVFDIELDPARPDTAAWLGLAGQFATLAERGLLARSPVAAAHFEGLLVHSLLRMVPHSHLDAMDSTRGTAGPPSLRRALLFCAENAAQPVTVGDIALAAMVSMRTLHHLFRVHLGTTPVRHLRTVRLAGAHADLVAIRTGQGDDTVEQVARRWGFANPGRFSAQYHAMYGRFPSETAGRSRHPAHGGPGWREWSPA